MKFLPIILLGAILSFGGCKPQRSAENTRPPATSETPPVETASVPPAQPANMPTLAGPTKEQAASTVRVRVASGGLPPQDYTGAQLRGSGCKIFVWRNPPEGQAMRSESLPPARLLQFDEPSGLAALDYLERFEATADAGYRIERQAFAGRKAGAVRTFASSGAQALGIEAGQVEVSANSTVTLRFPPSAGAAERDAGPAVVAAPATLIGFAGEERPATKITTLRDFKLVWKTPTLKPTGIGFGVSTGVRAGPSTTVMKVGTAIVTESENPALAPKRATLYAMEAPKEPDLSAVLSPASTERIDGKVIQTLSASPTNPNEWRSRLVAPAAEGEERAYLLQLGWPAFPNDGEDAIFSRPFLVRLRYQGGAVVPAVQGLQNLNERDAAAESNTAAGLLPES